MLEDRALRFRIRVCARIFRPRQFLMKAAPGTQAQILASGSGNQLDLSLIYGRRRVPQIPASTAANELLRQSSKARMSRHQPTKYEIEAVHWGDPHFFYE